MTKFCDGRAYFVLNIRMVFRARYKNGTLFSLRRDMAKTGHSPRVVTCNIFDLKTILHLSYAEH